MDFFEKVKKRWDKRLFVSVGLDPVIENIPQVIKKNYSKTEDILFEFNKAIIDATAEFVCCFKPNSAFYEAYGVDGIAALIKTSEYIKKNFSDIPVFLDAKRGDIGHTNEGYVQFAFDQVKADAITIQPYLGKESIESFLKRNEKGIFILVKTSNPGSGELQDLLVKNKMLYELLAKNIASDWNTHGNCGIVVGATYPKELSKIRDSVKDIPILIPGIGVQGGDIENTVKSGLDSKNQGIIINSSRGIIYASRKQDFTTAAKLETQKLTSVIQSHLE